MPANNVISWDEAKNQWLENNADNLGIIPYDLYSELPNPSVMANGALAMVIRDPQEFLNGLHIALGGGAQATYWTKV